MAVTFRAEGDCLGMEFDLVDKSNKALRIDSAYHRCIIIHLMLGSSVAEQVAVNHLVAGSNPARAAIIWIFYLVSNSGQRSNFSVQGSSANTH